MSYDINLGSLVGNAVIVLPYNVDGTLYNTVSFSGTSLTSTDSNVSSVTVYMSSNTWSGSAVFHCWPHVHRSCVPLAMSLGKAFGSAPPLC